MSLEGFNPSERASKARVAERDFGLVELSDLEREYESVLAREQMLNGRLEENNKEALQATDLESKQKGMEFGTKIARELQGVLERKAELEKRIKDAGGKLGEHTVQ